MVITAKRKDQSVIGFWSGHNAELPAWSRNSKDAKQFATETEAQMKKADLTGPTGTWYLDIEG